MNIKKVLSKVLVCSLIVASNSFMAMPSMKAKAAETKDGWKTLVLICPRTEIQKTPYIAAGTTLMYTSEVEKVKKDAKIMEETINNDSMNKANMTVDVAVSDMPIEHLSLSMADGLTINIEDILDKYAPQGKYDSVLVVYRNNDYTTNLGTTNITDLPKYRDTNGAIVTTVRLDDADHKMNYIDNIEPMYLIDRFAVGICEYLSSEGFSLDESYFQPYNDGQDLYQYNKGKRSWYRGYFAGLKWGENSKGGITEAMWNHRPTNK